MVTGIWVLLQQLARHQDESWGTKTALKCTRVNERLLHGIEFAIALHPLDRGHVGTIGVHRRKDAAGDSLAVDDDGAATTQALTTALASTMKSAIADQFHQRVISLHVFGDGLAIEAKLDEGTCRAHVGAFLKD